MKKFDKIYIGSGPLMMLDALNNGIKGEDILIIDRGEKLGGSWRSIDLFGQKDLENAVHYLLPNKKGYQFLDKFFDAELEKCTGKFYAIKIFGFKLILPVDNIFSRLLYFLNGGDQALNLSFINLFKNLFKKNTIKQTKYPRNGIVPIINNIIQSINKSNVKYNLNENLIKISVTGNKVFLKSNKDEYLTKQLYISHGFIPPKDFNIEGEKIIIKLKKHQRPSLHINTIMDKKNFKYINKLDFSQVLFPKGSNIKYVHQLSRYLYNKSNIDQHIIVAALKHDLKKSKKNFELIAKELEGFGLIPKQINRNKSDFFWQDILIPQIDTDDLKFISKKSNDLISYFYTECFNTSLGLYCERWNFPKNFFKL